ncbi:MAG: hypothetical protein ACOY3Y_14410 [Acidobacteriota bacterium]
MARALDLARLLDGAIRPVEAAAAYEAAIARENPEVDAFLDLAVLYFECCDGGYADYHRLSAEFVSFAWGRCMSVLDEAERRFGIHPEVIFWRNYFAIFLRGSRAFVPLCEGLVSDGRSLVPALHLFVESGGRQWRREAHELLQSVRLGATERQRYIKSVLESHSLLPIGDGERTE